MTPTQPQPQDRQPLLELSNATVIKDSTTILHQLTLTIHDGEHTAILGPNGSGKSSLLKLLTHHYYAVHTQEQLMPVRVFGKERWNIFELRSLLGIVSSDLHHSFINGNVTGTITGRDAVISGFFASQGLFGHQQVSADMQHRADQLLEQLGIEQLGPKGLDTMSTGEARRILIARALVTAPRALILDEPTTGLDLVAQ